MAERYVIGSNGVMKGGVNLNKIVVDNDKILTDSKDITTEFVKEVKPPQLPPTPPSNPRIGYGRVAESISKPFGTEKPAKPVKEKKEKAAGKRGRPRNPLDAVRYTKLRKAAARVEIDDHFIDDSIITTEELFDSNDVRIAHTTVDDSGTLSYNWD